MNLTEELLASALPESVHHRLQYREVSAEEALKHPWVLGDDQTEEEVDVCCLCAIYLSFIAVRNLNCSFVLPGLAAPNVQWTDRHNFR